ncbi:protein of unknown function (plasmid) [Shinella sp. WSC3-e]|nr:protein of unknown function [Shinella sp. WSC3-e]
MLLVLPEFLLEKQNRFASALKSRSNNSVIAKVSYAGAVTGVNCPTLLVSFLGRLRSPLLFSTSGHCRSLRAPANYRP